MIKKLRIKFIILTMVSLVFVLAFIMCGINLLNYRRIVKDADEILSVLTQNDGKFPEIDKQDMNDSEDQIPEDFILDDIEQRNPGSKRDNFSGIMSPETPYESRYFSVLFDDNKNIVFADTGKIAAINTEEAIDYAYEILEKSDQQGFIDIYRYVRVDDGNTTRIIFLDCSRNISAFRSFLLISCMISFVGILAVLLLIIIFSKRIVTPMANSYEKQKQFITDAGHEIKTPLTIIQADTELLEIECGEENEWLQDIQAQIRRLTNLTNDLICLARMEEGNNQLQMIDFPFSDMAEEVVQSFQAPAKRQNKMLDIHIQPLLTVNGDEKSLQQMVSILLDNALKYSPEGSEISLKIEKKNKNVYLKIKNATQYQMNNMQLEHLFDRFYRTDSSRNSQTGGHGIGLSIVKAIVEAHKGKISVALEQENFLCITIILPM